MSYRRYRSRLNDAEIAPYVDIAADEPHDWIIRSTKAAILVPTDGREQETTTQPNHPEVRRGDDTSSPNWDAVATLDLLRAMDTLNERVATAPPARGELPPDYEDGRRRS
jgi:hypothetical protein